MDLQQYAMKYCQLVDGSPGYHEQLTIAIRSLARHAGRQLEVDDLTEDIINGWLDAMRDRLSPVTRRQRRNMLVRLWKHAGRLGIASRRPDTDLIARIKLRQRPPQAWSIDQVRELLATVRSLSGSYKRRWPKGLFWQSWILSAWDTGWRSCDLFTLRIAQLSDRLCVVQRKTGRTIVSRLRPAALAAINAWLDATGRDREVIWPRWCRRGVWHRIAQRIVGRAGLPGSIGWLRASAGTACELAYPQRGYLFLGNSPAVFYAYYFDRTLSLDFPQPPEL